uniref:Reverse transcriptase n=1 Tax=Phytophthora ramorum TaxID=164328 RepID=H3GKL0_PHYRM
MYALVHVALSTPTTSSSKTPAASATASAVVASKATTAAASATTATGIASTAMPTSAATESRLSVAGYHSRWHEKHAIRNKTGKIIAVETGVGIYSPGGEGVPLDYGSEVEEGELEGDKDILSPGHTDPNVGLRRPREDDSNASSSKRSRSGSGTPLAAAGALTTPRDGDDSAPSAVVAASRTGSVREPWMPSQSEIGSRFEKEFVDELIVLELDDKFDMVLGMPWLARHDPVIDWTKRTIVRFGSSSSATESDGPVGAAHAPRGVEVKKARQLWEPTLQAVRTVANVPHRKCLRARVQPGCTTKRCAIKPGLNACARG